MATKRYRNRALIAIAMGAVAVGIAVYDTTTITLIGAAGGLLAIGLGISVVRDHRRIERRAIDE